MSRASFRQGWLRQFSPMLRRMPFLFCGKDLVLPFPGENMLQSIGKEKIRRIGMMLKGGSGCERISERKEERIFRGEEGSVQSLGSEKYYEDPPLRGRLPMGQKADF